MSECYCDSTPMELCVYCREKKEMSEDKAREFYLNVRDGLVSRGGSLTYYGTEPPKITHVIEKSAYDELQSKYSKAVEAMRSCLPDMGTGSLNYKILTKALRELGEKE